MLADDRPRVLLVDAGHALGTALCQALRRLGAQVTCFGEMPADAAGVRALGGRRERPQDWRALAGQEFDAVIDFGARGLEGAGQVAGHLRNRAGLVVQVGTWRVYAGARDAADAAGDASVAEHAGMPVPCPESAPLRDGLALGAEDGLWNARAGGGYPATVLRLAPLYGPGVRLAREWHCVGRLRAGRARVALPDGGGQLLHRLYVDNAVHAVLIAMNHPREADGHAFNVGDSRVPPVAALIEGCARVLDAELEGRPLPAALVPPGCPWAVPHPVVLDLHRLRARLGYIEPVDPDLGMERTVRWLADLAEDEILPTLEPYWRRFGGGHDYAAEDLALARWENYLASGARRKA